MNEFAIAENGAVSNCGNRKWLRRQFPGVTFPKGAPTDDWLSARNIYRVEQRPATIPDGRKIRSVQVPVFEAGTVRGYELQDK